MNRHLANPPGRNDYLEEIARVDAQCAEQEFTSGYSSNATVLELLQRRFFQLTPFLHHSAQRDRSDPK